MKKITLTLLVVLLLFASPLYAAEILRGSGEGAPACTLWLTNDVTVTYNNLANALNESHDYMGQGRFDPGEDITVCQIDVNVYGVVGTGATLQIEIHDQGAGTALTTPMTGGTSDTLAIGTGESGWKQFPGLNTSLSNAGAYAIAATRSDHGADISNYIRLYNGNADTISGDPTWWWGDDKTKGGALEGDVALKIYTLQP